MSTWISRTALAGAMALALAGCDEAAINSFAAELEGLSAGSGRARVAQTALAGGEVVLTAPDGYCLDRRSIRRGRQGGFAVMARCDTLGVRGFWTGHDLAIITVTTAPMSPGGEPPTLGELSASVGGARVLDRHSGDGLVMARFSGGASGVDGVSAEHWRGVFAVNGQVVALGLYAPEGSPALRAGGAAILSELTRKTRRASRP